MQKKQIAFDIDTKVAKAILGDNYTRIYRDIRSYLEDNGFTHIQGSVYMSDKPMSTLVVTLKINGLLQKHPYISKCVRDMTQTNVTSVSDLSALFQHDGTPGQYANMFQKKQTDKDITYDR